LTEQDIIEIQWKINNRPRKRFDYLSPIEKLQIETEIDAKVAFDA
jgi:IS30 family transposase